MPDYVCIVCQTRPPLGRSLIDGGCYARILGDLCTLEFAYEWLGAQMRAPAAAWKPGTIGRAGGSRPPLPLALHDAREDIHGTLAGWARFAAEAASMRGPADGTVPAIARWLRTQLHWISEREACREFAGDVADLRGTAYGLAPWGRARVDTPLPCPKCTLLSLSWYTGSETVLCRNRSCGHRMTSDDYVKAVLDLWERHQTRQEAAA